MKRSAVLIFAIPLLFYAFALAKRTDLATSDLGRHLKNGELIVFSIVNSHKLPFEILHTNYYSYSNGDYQTINHHWLSGVIYYLCHRFFGFVGVSGFFLILSLATMGLFLVLAKNLSTLKMATVSATFSLPLIAERTEIRPEAFSYFLSGLLIFFLQNYLRAKLSLRKILIATFLLSAFWINFHIYFFLGFVIIGAFLVSEMLSKGKRIKHLIFVLLAFVGGLCVNPFGLKGITYPLKINIDYGYRVVENQTVLFLDNLGFVRNSNLLYAKIVVFALICILLLTIIRVKKNRAKFDSYWVFVLAVAGAFAGFVAIRNLTIFGFFILLFFSAVFCAWDSPKANSFASVLGVILGTMFFIPKVNSLLGLGIMPKNLASRDFFIENNIKGPIFNNYDIGGFLIFILFPKEKVFVDNRPEAYPSTFLKDAYIASQESEDVWNALQKQANFNAIFFSYRDATPWGQKFLKARLEDNNWAPVFVDKYTIILLKKSLDNKEIIDKWEIPKSQFVFR
jgi:hypothetical protein